MQPLPAWLWEHPLHSSPHQHPHQVNFRNSVLALLIPSGRATPTTWTCLPSVTSRPQGGLFLSTELSTCQNSTPVKPLSLNTPPALVYPRGGLLSSPTPTMVLWLTTSGERKKKDHSLTFNLLTVLNWDDKVTATCDRLEWPGGLWKFWSSSHLSGRALAVWRLNRAWLGMSKFGYLNKKQWHFKLTRLYFFIYLLIYYVWALFDKRYKK